MFLIPYICINAVMQFDVNLYQFTKKKKLFTMKKRENKKLNSYLPV